MKWRGSATCGPWTPSTWMESNGICGARGGDRPDRRLQAGCLDAGRMVQRRTRNAGRAAQPNRATLVSSSDPACGTEWRCLKGDRSARKGQYTGPRRHRFGCPDLSHLAPVIRLQTSHPNHLMPDSRPQTSDAKHLANQSSPPEALAPQKHPLKVTPAQL